MRLCTECNKSISSISNICLICHILWHFQNGRPSPWEFHTGTKLKDAPISLKIVSTCRVCLVIRIPKIYSFMHFRCLVFKLHKIIGQRSFQICTGVEISNCSDSNETYLKLFVLTHRLRKRKTKKKRIVLYTSDGDLWPVNPFIHYSLCTKLPVHAP